MQRRHIVAGLAASAIALAGAAGVGVVVSQAAPAAQTAAQQRVGIGATFSDANGVVTVRTVKAGGPAATAGIQNGDQIRSFAGTNVTTASQIDTLIRARAAGDAVPVVLVRSGQSQTVTVALANEAGKGAMAGGQCDQPGTIPDGQPATAPRGPRGGQPAAAPGGTVTPTARPAT